MEKGVRYRVHTKSLPDAPDISIKKYQLAIFVDGEFWHGYNWNEKRGKLKNNKNFWIPKIERNMQKDREVNFLLKEKGYTIFRFWESELKKNIDSCISDIMGYIQSYPYLKT